MVCSPGLLKDHTYLIRLKEGVGLCSVSASRHVKFLLVLKLKAELERLQKLCSVRELTDPTDSILPVVPVLKKNWQVRVCID